MSRATACRSAYSRHVDAHHGALVVEEEVGERLGELGLAHAGRPEEEERSGRPVGVGQPGPRAPHRVGDGAHGVGLADEPRADELLHVQQLLGLALQQPPGRDAGPRRDHLGDVVGADAVLDHDVGDRAEPPRPYAAPPAPAPERSPRPR
jgi:hypothetical protein